MFQAIALPQNLQQKTLTLLYAVQQDTQSVSMSEFYSALMLARHVSDLICPSSGAFLQAVFADLVCGNLRNGCTCRVVRTVVPHTKSAKTACTKRS